MSDKYEYARALKSGPSTSAYLSDKKRSTSKTAVYMRQRRLLSDELEDKANAATKKSQRKAKAKKLVSKFKASNTCRNQNALTARVKHHLSKGRDVSDIAIREMVMVSDVQRIIEAINKEGNQ